MTQILTVRRALVLGILHTLVMFVPAARAEDARPERRETFFMEAGFGMSQTIEDAYVQRLEDFRFESDTGELFVAGNLWAHAESLGYMLTPNFGLLVRHELLESRGFVRYLTDDKDDRYNWDSRAISLGARARKPLHREWFAVYAQANLGLGIARTRYRNHGQELHKDTKFGPSLGVLGGVDLNFFKYGGMFVEGGYTFAPLLENDFGDGHNDGGLSLLFGLRIRMLEEK